jgi:hypothetical protein
VRGGFASSTAVASMLKGLREVGQRTGEMQSNDMSCIAAMRPDSPNTAAVEATARTASCHPSTRHA